MSVRLDAGDQDAIVWGTNLPDTGAFTLMAWARPDLTGAVGQPNVFSLGEEGVNGRSLFLSGGTEWALFDGGATTNVGVTATDDAWYICALVGNGTSIKAYVKLDTAGSFTTVSATQSGTPTENSLDLGRWIGPADYWHGLLRSFKQWDAALSDAEIDAEAAFLCPSRGANLQRWIRLVDAADTADQSGNGFNPTIVGALTTDAAEPVTPLCHARRPDFRFIPNFKLAQRARRLA